MKQLHPVQVSRTLDPPVCERVTYAWCSGGAQEEDAELRPLVHLPRTEVLNQQDRADLQILDVRRRPNGLAQALIPSSSDPKGAIGEVPTSVGRVKQQHAQVPMLDHRDLGDLMQRFVGGHGCVPLPCVHACPGEAWVTSSDRRVSRG